MQKNTLVFLVTMVLWIPCPCPLAVCCGYHSLFMDIVSLFRLILLYTPTNLMTLSFFFQMFSSVVPPTGPYLPTGRRFYLEMHGAPGVPLEEVSARLSNIGAMFVEEALQPERWGMKRVALA